MCCIALHRHGFKPFEDIDLIIWNLKQLQEWKCKSNECKDKWMAGWIWGLAGEREHVDLQRLGWGGFHSDVYLDVSHKRKRKKKFATMALHNRGVLLSDAFLGLRTTGAPLPPRLCSQKQSQSKLPASALPALAARPLQHPRPQTAGTMGGTESALPRHERDINQAFPPSLEFQMRPVLIYRLANPLKREGLNLNVLFCTSVLHFKNGHSGKDLPSHPAKLSRLKKVAKVTDALEGYCRWFTV